MLPPVLAALTGAVVLFAPGTTETASANGDTRTIHLHHAHTHESIDATFMVDGRYDPVALEKLNWFLRDWRRDEPTHMDPKLFDTVWEVYRESGSQQPVEVMSAYRSPETNSMLRHATRGVAEHSQHILGKAMDQHYVDVPMSKIRELAMRLQRGGVGFYPTAGTPFVHMDVGGVRHWPRMSYDQLSRLFPDGKTVHLPSNGQPLAGYEMARAELEARGDSFNYPTAGEVKSKGFFAWLFGSGDDEGDGEASREGGVPRDTAPAPRPSRSRVAATDPAPVGTTGNDAVISNGKDAGIHLFSFLESKAETPVQAPAPAAEPVPSSRRGGRGRSQVASLPVAQPADAEAQQKLAAEMLRQEQAKAAAEQAAADQAASRQAQAPTRGEPVEPPVEADVASKQPSPLPATRARPSTAAVPSGGPDAPLPPRRPTEVASTGPVSAGPPIRPDDHAPVPGMARVATAASTVASPPGRSGLPAAITQGLGPTPPHVLSFASPAFAVPLPVVRPPLVAARLDRPNVHSLTGPTTSGRRSTHIGPGSAPHPAARAGAASPAGDGTARRRGSGAHATDLSTDRFTSTAVTSRDHVTTAKLHKRPAAAGD